MNGQHAAGGSDDGRRYDYRITLSHVRLSSYADQVEAETLAWMFGHQLFQDERHFKRVQKMEIRKYAGYAHPFGLYADILLFAKYITLWLLWDDFVIEKEVDTGALMDEMKLVFDAGSGHAASKDNYIRAWQSIIADYLRRGASPAFISRLGRNMLNWMQTAAQEKMSVHETNREMFQVYLDRRIITIGMIPTAQLLELSANVGMAETGLAHQMTIESAKIVAFANELVSVAKDNDWLNLVVIYREINRCSLDEAYCAVVAMHDAAVQRYAVLLGELEADKQEWGKYLQYCAEGFSYWHTVCPRYNDARIGANLAPEAYRQ